MRAELQNFSSPVSERLDGGPFYTQSYNSAHYAKMLQFAAQVFLRTVWTSCHLKIQDELNTIDIHETITKQI